MNHHINLRDDANSDPQVDRSDDLSCERFEMQVDQVLDARGDLRNDSLLIRHATNCSCCASLLESHLAWADAFTEMLSGNVEKEVGNVAEKIDVQIRNSTAWNSDLRPTSSRYPAVIAVVGILIAISSVVWMKRSDDHIPGQVAHAENHVDRFVAFAPSDRDDVSSLRDEALTTSQPSSSSSQPLRRLGSDALAATTESDFKTDWLFVRRNTVSKHFRQPASRLRMAIRDASAPVLTERLSLVADSAGHHVSHVRQLRPAVAMTPLSPVVGSIDATLGYLKNRLGDQRDQHDRASEPLGPTTSKSNGAIDTAVIA